MPSGLKPGRAYEGEVEIVSTGGRFTIIAPRQCPWPVNALPGLEDGNQPAARDVDFLRERMLILKDIKSPTAIQESEQIVIGHLIQVCKGGDVAVALQRAIEGAQGWRGQAYLAEASR